MEGFTRSFPYTNYHDLNLDWILQTVKADAAAVSEMGGAIAKLPDEYETKDSITNARKLSVSGNFTGTIYGKPAQTMINELVDARSTMAVLYEMLVNHGGVGFVYDGGLFTDGGEIINEIDGGLF